ncbi:hypothetical protein SESBI_14819 [Sesbania bispinosa]|nr:hypothetical protein SESBI_14819 [Sesbania bispinosa]
MGSSLVPNENPNGRDVEAKKNMEGLQQHTLKKKERNLKSSSEKGLQSLESKNKGVSYGSQKNMSSISSEAKKKKDQWQESHIDVGHKQCHNIPKSSRSSSSYVSLPEDVYLEDVYSETSNSSVLPSKTDLASTSETTEHSVNTDLDVDPSSVVSKKPGCSSKMSSLQSEDTFIEKDVLDIRNQCAFSNMKESQDHETAEMTAQRVCNPSSQPQLSFGLNRIGRSFSFKEGSTLPKLSCSLSSKGSMSSMSFRTSNLDAEKSKESSTQALLQLTIKNGLPLFQFVLNNERKVLAATMKSLASPEKDDVGCYFNFYLVDEIKKKSELQETVYGEDYVLFGVEIDQTDQEPQKFIKSRELAAAVIEIPCENVCFILLPEVMTHDQKLPISLEMSNKQEEINEELNSKNNNELQGKVRKNYNPIPPLSPVDRV